jgi:hypothetical protein
MISEYILDRFIFIIESKINPLYFKPQLENILDSDSMPLSTKEEDPSSLSNEIYKPPKLTSVIYDENSRSRALRHEEILQKKAKRSRLIKDLQEEFQVEPEEISFSDRFIDDQASKKREAYEEEYFVRLNSTKKDRLKAKKLSSINQDFEVRLLKREMNGENN